MALGEQVVISYVGDISDVKRQVKQLERLNKAVAKNAGKQFTKGFTIVKQEITKITQVAKGIKLPSGTFTNQTKQMTTVVRGLNGELKTVRQTVAGTGKNIRIMNQTIRNGANVTRTMGQNLATLAKRAALTIPLWFALRRGVQAVFSTIRDGLKAIIDFDRALQKARRNLQGSAQDIERNFGVLQKEITKLSLETGRSVEEITNAFQKFATVGFDFETSLAGANSATKTAILLFGDATDTANAFARTMRVLVDTSKDAKPASDQLSDVMALTVELWKDNAFELNEFTSALERFAPVAKTAGFSAAEATKIIATLGTAALRGSRGGRLLGTSITRLVTKTDELAKSLGIKVNPEVDRTFDVFIKTLDVLTKMRQETDKVAPGFEKIVKSLFGIRSSQAVKGLIALNKELKKNLAVTGDITRFNKEFEEVNKTVFQLATQFKNLNKEIGKALVTGLAGGEDFRDSLEEIVEFQNQIIKNARAVGRALTISTRITFGNTDLLQIEIIESIKKILKEANVEALFTGAVKIINKAITGQLTKVELEELIIEIRDDKIKLPKDLKQNVETSLKNELSNVLAEITTNVSLNKTEISLENQQKLIKALIKDQLERFKLAGATESQLLKINDALIRETDINDNIITQKIRQLEIDRKITEEQKARVKFSSDSVKLATIAKEEGLQTAVAISEVLSGQRDFNTFLRQGGERAEILKENFKDFVKNQELLKFFTGRGTSVQIQENVGQRDFTPIRAESQFELAKARIGLKNSTDKSISATEKNTLSIQQLTSSFLLGQRALRGDEISRVDQNLKRLADIQNRATIANLPIGSATGTPQRTTKSIIDFNLTIDGKNIASFAGSPEAIDLLINKITPAFQKEAREELQRQINNPKSPTNNNINDKISDF